MRTVVIGLMFLLAFTHGAIAQDKTTEDQAVRRTAELYTSDDPDKMREGFLPTATLIFMKDDQMQVQPVADYIQTVATQIANHTRPKIVKTIESVDRAGDAAVVKVVGVGPNFIATDYLTVLKTAGGWKIVLKAYYVDRTGKKADAK